MTRHPLLLTALALWPMLAAAAAGRDDIATLELAADRFLAGGALTVTAPVAGDLIAAGGTIDVLAEVGGDVVVAGGTIRLDAPIRQGVYVAGGRVSLDAPVQRNVRIFGGNVEISRQGKIAGNATLGGGDVRVLGPIEGYLQIGGGRAFLNGPVGGNVEIASGRLELGPGARIHGKLRYASRSELRRDPAAQVDGGVERMEPAEGWPVRARLSEGARRRGGWLWTVGLIVIAAVLAAGLPDLYERVGDTVRTRWAWATLLGFIFLACVPVAVVLLLVTIIGIPLALAGLALYPALLLLGYASAGVAGGQLALHRFQPALAARTGWRIVAAVLGMLAISVLGRLPVLGGLVVFAALLLGTGALLLQWSHGAKPAAPSRPA